MRADERRQEYIKENGNYNNFDSLDCDYFTASEIVGYYLETYREEAYKIWLENLKYSENILDNDDEVTRILGELS